MRVPALTSAVLAFSLCALAADAVDSYPVINGDNHRMGINDVSTDAAGRLLLTAGGDRTGRLWDIASRKLLRVLRASTISCTKAAMSPDGKLAALSGERNAGFYEVQLFNAETGELVRRLADRREAITDMLFSPDGRFLVTAHRGLTQKDGSCLCVFLISGQLFVQQLFVEWSSLTMDWHPAIGLLVSGESCPLRLYTMPEGKRSLTLVRTLAANGAHHSPRFSANGRTLGLVGRTGLDLYDADPLSFRMNVPLGKGGSGIPFCLALSDDGGSAHIGGRKNSVGAGLLERWGPGGPVKGGVSESTVAARILSSLCPAGPGKFFHCSFDGSFRLSGHDGTQHWKQESAWLDFTEMDGKLWLSLDGSAVIMAPPLLNGRRIAFALTQGKLADLPANSGIPTGFNVPLQSGLPVKDWADPVTGLGKIKFRGAVLDNAGASSTMAIAPDRSFFVVGSAYALKCYSAEGKPLWVEPLGLNCRAVNFSRDGGLAVAAMDDGSIQWFATAEQAPELGRKLLTLYPCQDGRRWVIYTPQGYYDASPDGHDLLGMQTNRSGSEAAIFTPMSQLRETFHRPDIVAEVFRTRSVAKGTEAAAKAALPAAVR